jgi:DNA-binding MarR family transcriptional regulator
VKQKSAGTEAGQEPELDLQAFFPYRLSVLYDEVSRSVSQVYSERFKLTRHQWRVLALLGGKGAMSAKDISRLTHMGKMRVSRTVSQLTDNGYLDRRVDSSDRRHQRLSLTRAGHRLYLEIVPLVCAREDFILSSLTADEQRQFDELMEKILLRSRELQAIG